MKTIVTNIVITRFSSRVDGSLSFNVSTPELTAVEKVAFMELHGKSCRAVIEPLDYTPESKLEVKSDVGIKTPSERLRGCLFVYYKQEMEGKPEAITFNQFYEQHMEKFCDHVKGKLKP